MIRLFSRFDIIFFNFQKLIYVLLFTYLLSFFYIKRSFNFFIGFLIEYMNRFFNRIKSKRPKFIYRSIFSVFLIVFTLNFTSVHSYNFAFTSQIRLVLILRFSIWASFILFNVVKNFKGILSHRVPLGTPLYLVWFLFLIELVSNFIRFITLSVRLTANILAGHLLIILLRKIALYRIIVRLIYIGLNIVEIFVSLVQAYIICTILILYFSEID